MQKSIRVQISGRVQGVSYRAYTRRKALELGLKGFVENRPDGTVYLEAEGPADQIDALIEWCHKGSPLAKVKEVQPEVIAPVGYGDFVVRR
jgi:acylphosphatase